MTATVTKLHVPLDTLREHAHMKLALMLIKSKLEFIKEQHRTPTSGETASMYAITQAGLGHEP